jgi:hypothetical protein
LAAVEVALGNPMIPKYYTQSSGMSDNLAILLYYYLAAACIETLIAYAFLIRYGVDYGKLIVLIWVTNLVTYILVQYYAMDVGLEDVGTILQAEFIPLLFEFLVYYVFLKNELHKITIAKRVLLLTSLVVCANLGSFSLSFIE